MSENLALTALSSLLLLAGHFTRTFRFGFLLEGSLKSSRNRILWGLNISYVINYFFPFRFGEIVRIIFTTQRPSIKSISLTALFLFMERSHDLLVLCSTSIILFISLGNSAFFDVANSLFKILLSFLTGVLLLTYKKDAAKRSIYSISKRFEPILQTKFMDAVFISIFAWRRNVKRLMSLRYQLLTVAMWASYFGSLYVASQIFWIDDGRFDELYLYAYGVTTNFWQLDYLPGGNQQATYSRVLFATSAIIFVLLTATFMWGKVKASSRSWENYEEQRPVSFVNVTEQKNFLSTYFEGRNAHFCNSYLKLNGNSLIIRDSSGASTATTAVIQQGEKVLFRKYDGVDPQYLKSQSRKMRDLHELGYVEILKEHDLESFFAFDMPFKPELISLSQFSSYLTNENFKDLSYEILTKYESRIRNASIKSSNEVRCIEYEKTNKYLVSQMKKRTHLIPALVKHYSLPEGEIILNGNRLTPLSSLLEYIDGFDEFDLHIAGEPHLIVHGDLTPDNIVVDVKNPIDYYLIDPDPRIHYGSLLVDISKYLNFYLIGFAALEHIDLRRESESVFNVSQQELERFKIVKASILEHFQVNCSMAVFQRQLLNYELVHTLRVMAYQPRDKQIKILLRFLQEFSDNKELVSQTRRSY